MHAIRFIAVALLAAVAVAVASSGGGVSDLARQFNAAWTLVERNQLQPAITKLKLLLVQYPKEPSVASALMMAQRNAGEIDAAIRTGQGFMRLPPLDDGGVSFRDQPAKYTPKSVKKALRPFAKPESAEILNLMCQLLVHATTESALSRWSHASLPVRLEFGHSATATICETAITLLPSDHTLQYAYSLGRTRLSMYERFTGADKQLKAVELHASHAVTLQHAESALTLLAGAESGATDPARIQRVRSIVHMYRTQYCRMLCWLPEYRVGVAPVLCARGLLMDYRNALSADDLMVLTATAFQRHRSNPSGMRALFAANQLAVEERGQGPILPPPPASRPPKCRAKGKPKRVLIQFWSEPSEYHTVEPFDWPFPPAAGGDLIGSAYRFGAVRGEPTGAANATLPVSWVSSHAWFIVSFPPDELIEVVSQWGILASSCAVFAGTQSGVNARLAEHWPGYSNETTNWAATKHTDCPVIWCVHPHITNYYHFMTEVLARVIVSQTVLAPRLEQLIARDRLTEPDGVTPCMVRYAMYDQLPPYAVEALEMIGIDFDDPNQVLRYDVNGNDRRRFTFKRLYVVDWTETQSDALKWRQKASRNALKYFQSNEFAAEFGPTNSPGKKRASGGSRLAVSDWTYFSPLSDIERAATAHAEIARDESHALNQQLTAFLDQHRSAIELDLALPIAVPLSNGGGSGSTVTTFEYARFLQLQTVRNTSYPYDMWSPVLVPRLALALVRDRMRKAARTADPTNELSPNVIRIVYASRGRRAVGNRSVRGEEALLDALNQIVADFNAQQISAGSAFRLELLQFSGSTLSVKQQIALFAPATVLIGPHGAALTNSLWMSAARGGTVLPFHVQTDEPVWHHTALSLGLKVVSMNEMSSAYADDYLITPARSEYVCVLVRYAIKERMRQLLAAAAATVAAPTPPVIPPPQPSIARDEL